MQYRSRFIPIAAIELPHDILETSYYFQADKVLLQFPHLSC